MTTCKGLLGLNWLKKGLRNKYLGLAAVNITKLKAALGCFRQKEIKGATWKARAFVRLWPAP